MLRQKARERTGTQEFIPLDSASQPAETTGHVNFFQEVEDGTAEYKKANKEHDKEKKEEQEKYEKQIGYLTYLGQDTNEALGKKNWYEVAPDRSSKYEGEVGLKTKLLHDPLTVMKKYTEGMKPKQEQLTQKLNKHVFPITTYNSEKQCSPRGSSKSTRGKRRTSSSDLSEKSHRHEKKKHKKHKASKKSESKLSSDELSEESEDETYKEEKRRKLEILRMERLAREREERKRTESLLAKINGTDSADKQTTRERPIMKRKYNSQFNPEIAKQNY